MTFGTSVTESQLNNEIDVLKERFAQSGIAINVIETKIGEPIPASFSGPNGYEFTGGRFFITPDEREAILHLDSDGNSVDFLYVPDLNDGVIDLATLKMTPINGCAYAAFVNNKSTEPKRKNFIILGPTRTELTAGHELMHILLNSGHRVDEFNNKTDPTTALFAGLKQKRSIRENGLALTRNIC